MRIRRLIAILTGIWLTTAPLASPFAQVMLPDGKYATVGAYLAGAWTWHDANRNEDVRMVFGPGDALQYDNLTSGVRLYGKYAVLPDSNLRLTLSRTCDKNGAQCQNRAEPLIVVDKVTPVSANVFTSNGEQWKRAR